ARKDRQRCPSPDRDGPRNPPLHEDPLRVPRTVRCLSKGAKARSGRRLRLAMLLQAAYRRTDDHVLPKGVAIMRQKFIFVTGGVVSSLGKGLASASIGALLESRGLTVTLKKLDPYINVDPGTMNPFQ